MSDTPETDSHPLWHGEPAVHIDFARKLERERDEARIQVKLLKVENNHNWQAMDIANEVTRERDQWRKCAEELAQIIDDLDAHDEPTLTRINESVDRFRHLKEASK